MSNIIEKKLSELSVGDKFKLKYDLIRTAGGFSYKVQKSDKVFEVFKVNKTTIQTVCGIAFKFASAGKHWRSQYDNGTVEIIK